MSWQKQPNCCANRIEAIDNQGASSVVINATNARRKLLNGTSDSTRLQRDMLEL